MAFTLGIDVKTYRYESGAAAVSGVSPADWPLVGNIKDENLGKSAATSDVSTRSAGGWRQLVATLREMTATFQIVFDPTDPDYIAFDEAYFTNGVIPMRFFDSKGEVSDTPIGFEADFMVTNFTENRQLEEAVMIDVELTIARGSTTPTRYDGTTAIT